jgi:osmotically-inducible protein OsmY
MRSANAFLIGLGTAYFFDPSLGKSRRAVARDRGAKLTRRALRTAQKRARFAAGKTEGLYARGRNAVTQAEVATDDATVEQRIRSEAFRDIDVSGNAIEIQVEDGVVTLTGAVATEDLVSDLVQSVSKVAGVKEVAAEVRLESEAR